MVNDHIVVKVVNVVKSGQKWSIVVNCGHIVVKVVRVVNVDIVVKVAPLGFLAPLFSPTIPGIEGLGPGLFQCPLGYFSGRSCSPFAPFLCLSPPLSRGSSAIHFARGFPCPVGAFSGCLLRRFRSHHLTLRPHSTPDVRIPGCTRCRSRPPRPCHP